MRIAVLVKQIPVIGQDMRFTPDGRLQREGLPLEMNAYCRRAVSQGVDLARATEGTCTVLTMGPPSAEDCLREAIAWGADGGILISDPALVGSDTLATAKTLAAALAQTGPFDVILVGQNSVDADTGQVGPSIAQLLGLPFLGPVRQLSLDDRTLAVRCQRDDGWADAAVDLPAVLSCAERLCEPCKAPPAAREAVDSARITRVTADALGPGPWGVAASPTKVGRSKTVVIERRRVQFSGDVKTQVRHAVDLLIGWGALPLVAVGDEAGADLSETAEVPSSRHGRRIIAVVMSAETERAARGLLGRAAELTHVSDARVVAIGPVAALCRERLGAWGADALVDLAGSDTEEDIASALAAWCRAEEPWAVLIPGTTWGREVGARAAVALGAGLVGDAVDLEVEDDRLVAWKPAMGDGVTAAITSVSPVQMVTVRAGVFPLLRPRAQDAPPRATRIDAPRVSRIRPGGSAHEGGIGELAAAKVVVGIGSGVDPAAYSALEPLLTLLGAELAATRKVTDRGWLPHARQVGVTGHSISPRLYVAVGCSGKFNHMVGVRKADFVLAINVDPKAPVFHSSDVGIVGDWREAVDCLVTEYAARVPAHA